MSTSDNVSLKPNRKQAKKYQHFGAAYLALRNGAILGDEAGLGKTFTAISAVQTIKATEVLIVCPLSLKYWWAQEIEASEVGTVTIQQNPAGVGYWVVEVADPARGSKLIRRYTLAHYEQFQDGKTTKQAGKTIRQPSRLCLPYLAIKYDVVIADECQHVKNRKAQRTYWLGKVQSKYRWGLTGTPLAEYPQDLWSILHWVDPKGFTSYWRFVAQYWEQETGYSHGGATFNKVSGLKWGVDPQTGEYSTAVTLRVLQQHLAKHLLVRRREDVGIELPPITITDLPIALSDKQRKFYDEVRTQSVIELIQEFGDPDIWDLTGDDKLIIRQAVARFTRLNQVTSAPTVFKPGLPNAKLDWLKEYADGGTASIIMTRFNHTKDAINDVLVKADRTDFVVGTYGTLAEGHNLQQYNHIIMWDAPQSRLQYEQAYHRIRRIGQERPQQITRLIAKQTIDERAWKHIDQKDDDVAAILEWLRGLKK